MEKQHVDEISRAIKEMLGSENSAKFKALGVTAYHALKPNLSTAGEAFSALMLAQQYMMIEELKKLNENIEKLSQQASMKEEPKKKV